MVTMRSFNVCSIVALLFVQCLCDRDATFYDEPSFTSSEPDYPRPYHTQPGK